MSPSPEPPSSDESPRPVVHVLIDEAFFRDRAVAALQALQIQALLPADWPEDVAALVERVAAVPAAGAVVDLEAEAFSGVDVAAALRADPRCSGWHLLCYSGGEDEVLDARAVAAGLEVVPRSSFAANLVRLLGAFRGDLPGPGGLTA